MMIPEQFPQPKETKSRMRSCLGATLGSLFLLAGCSGHPGETRIEGEFAHIDRGEFLIYSSEEGHGRLDTLHIEDGRFSYTLHTLETAILHLLYPNQSELTVFATPDADIDIEGDAQNLNEVEVSGSEDNEIYTAFRLETNGKSEAEKKAAARRFLLEHPTLTMSRYLFTTFFLSGDTPADEVQTLYDSLCRACPDDLNLSKLAIHVRAIDKLKVGNPLPDFTLSLRPDLGGNGPEEKVVRREDYKGECLFIAFWASWRGGSQSALYRARRLRREMKAKGKDINLLSYSLDADQKRLDVIVKSDSIDYPLYCDFLALSSPLVQQWGITQLPYYILVNAEGVIVASGTDWMNDINQAANEL